MEYLNNCHSSFTAPMNVFEDVAFGVVEYPEDRFEEVIDIASSGIT